MKGTEKVSADEIKVGDSIKTRYDGFMVVKWIEEFPKTRRFRGRKVWVIEVEVRRSTLVVRKLEASQ